MNAHGHLTHDDAYGNLTVILNKTSSDVFKGKEEYIDRSPKFHYYLTVENFFRNTAINFHFSICIQNCRCAY